MSKKSVKTFLRKTFKLVSVLLLFYTLSSCGFSEVIPVSDTNTDNDEVNLESDGSGNENSGDEDNGEDQNPCDGDCSLGRYNTCTCGVDDPCGWQEDGFCDDRCDEAAPDRHFDDEADCSKPKPGDELCTNTCRWAADGACDDGGPDSEYSVCDLGTDCDDCGPRPVDPAPAEVCTNTCRWAGDGACDDGGPDSAYDVCDFGTDCDDCGPRSPDSEPGVTCTNTCRWAGDGECDDGGPDSDYSVCDLGTDCDDCGPRAVEPDTRTFGITAVDDDLDPEDMFIIASELTDIGYEESFRDRNVSTSELIGYLNTDVTTLYHTGHGHEGSVSTSDGSVRVGSTTIQARNVIWATCLTLDEDWGPAFGPQTETVLGYTENSFDGTDETVARSFARNLGNGQDHITAWYNSNITIGSLSDRWAGYVREGSTIVEYSARSGRRPVLDVARIPLIEIDGAKGLRVAATVLADDRTFEDQFAELEVLVESSEMSTRTEANVFHLLGDVDFSEAHARVIAQEHLDGLEDGRLTEEATLDRILPIMVRTGPTVQPEIHGYIVRYRRQISGLLVRGNTIEDHIAFLIGPDGVVAESRYWPNVSVVERRSPDGELLTVGEATTFSTDAISQLLKGGEFNIVEAIPVYGTLGTDHPLGEQLIPAFELRGDDGTRIVVSALTGEVLG